MSESAARAVVGQNILVVEDDPQVCELLADMLRADGFKVVCVQRDEAAYSALERLPAFACMIVDVNLGPGTTGYDVARFARRVAPALPVIFVSGQSSPDSFAVNSVPGSLFLEKPFTTHDLLDRVRMLVGDNDD